jgi:hypothetical protein
MLCDCMCDGVQGSQSDAVPWAIQVTWLPVHQEVHLLFVNVGVHVFSRSGSKAPWSEMPHMVFVKLMDVRAGS